MGLKPSAIDDEGRLRGLASLRRQASYPLARPFTGRAGELDAHRLAIECNLAYNNVSQVTDGGANAG